MTISSTFGATNTATLFKWWSTDFWNPMNYEGLHGVNNLGEECEWCRAPIKYEYKEVYANSSNTFYYSILNQCLVCGWYLDAIGRLNRDTQQWEYKGIYSTLREFAIDDEQVLIEELGAYLRSHFSDIYVISPRRLEELVEDVFRSIGYHTRLTQRTRDGGADIILLDGGGKQAIVEVKRYALQRHIGVDLVRQLIGAQLIHGVSKSYLVTTSSFSEDAVSASKSPQIKKHQLEVELWDAVRLLQALSCYDDTVLQVGSINPSVPLYQQIPLVNLPRRRLLRAPYRAYWGKRVSYIDEEDNLSRWQNSDQPVRWVEKHQYCWNNEDWLSLLDELRNSEYWPMNPNKVGEVLEDIKSRQRTAKTRLKESERLKG